MSKAEILIIDDEPQIRKLLEIALESNDYKVRLGSHAKEGIALAANHSPDLILLDIGLPDKNGLDVLHELRQWYTKPIIMLSVQNGENIIVSALDMGATDYIMKPFRTAELLARIRVSLRSFTHNTAESMGTFGELAIDFAARTVKKGGDFVKLTATEFNLLCLMAKNEGRVLTHGYLLKQVWGVGYQTETQYLRVFVASLRKKIEDEPTNPKHIITETGVGYRFM